MSALCRSAALLLAAALAAPLPAQTATPSASLLVLSKRDQTLSIVDPATLQVVARVPIGNDPHEVVTSPDGATAYVSNYGSGAFHTLAVVDLLAQKPLPSIDLGPLRGPHGLAFAQGEVWFTAEAAKAIGRYSPSTRKVDWILGTGQNRTHMIYVSADARQIVTTNVSSGTVSLIAEEPVRMGPPPGPGGPGGGPPPGAPPPNMPRTDWNETVVRVGNGSEGFDVSPDHQEIWVANAHDGTISVLDLPTKQVVATLQANVPGANRLKFTPDGKQVLVSAGPDLVILDASSRQVLKRLPIGHGSGGVLVQPDGARAFVSCGPDNTVVAVDLHTLRVVGHIAAGQEPDGLAWAVRP